MFKYLLLLLGLGMVVSATSCRKGEEPMPETLPQAQDNRMPSRKVNYRLNSTTQRYQVTDSTLYYGLDSAKTVVFINGSSYQSIYVYQYQNGLVHKQLLHLGNTTAFGPDYTYVLGYTNGMRSSSQTFWGNQDFGKWRIEVDPATRNAYKIIDDTNRVVNGAITYSVLNGQGWPIHEVQQRVGSSRHDTLKSCTYDAFGRLTTIFWNENPMLGGPIVRISYSYDDIEIGALLNRIQPNLGRSYTIEYPENFTRETRTENGRLFYESSRVRKVLGHKTVAILQTERNLEQNTTTLDSAVYYF